MIITISLSSVQFSHSVVSDSLRPHESQHARPPCPSPTPRVHSDSRPSSQWCHPAISSSVVLFSSCPQSLPASESFPMSQLFAWGGQSTGVSLVSIYYYILAIFFLSSKLLSTTAFATLHNTVLLTIVTMLFTTSPELLYFIAGSLYFLTTFTHFAYPLCPQ